MIQAHDFFLAYRHVTASELRPCLAAYTALTRGVQRGGPRLTRMQEFMEELQHPEQGLRAIHVAGTSGKGSTTTMIATLLATQGFRVGLTVSPHVHDLTERIQINGVPISSEDLSRLLRRCFEILAGWSARGYELPHYFELMTALAFLWFAEQKTDYVVIETGLGGRYDATNVLRSNDKIAVLTPIDLDHQRLLGNTRAEIALEKSGIMVPLGMVWSAPQPDEVQAVLSREAAQQQVTLSYAPTIAEDVIKLTKIGTSFSYQAKDHHWNDLSLRAIGLHQAQNATLALDVVHALAVRDGWSVSEASVREGLARVSLPGRFEVRTCRSRTVIVDVAHNPQKLRSFLETAQALFPGTPIELVLGLNSLDHADAIARVLQSFQVRVRLVDMEVGDAYQHYLLADAKVLESVFQKAGIPLAPVVTDLGEYLRVRTREASNKLILISGSFYLVSHALPILDRVC